MEEIEVSLGTLGISNTSAKVLTALIKSGPTTAYKLSKVISIPAPKVYQILSQLEFQGLVVQISQSPKVYDISPTFS